MTFGPQVETFDEGGIPQQETRRGPLCGISSLSRLSPSLARSLLRLQSGLNQAADVRRRERQSLRRGDGIEPGCSRIHCAFPKVLPL